MNKKELEQEEQYYMQYNHDAVHPREREEIRAFSLYARMRHQLQNAKVPNYDRNSLVNRMVMKMGERPGRFLLFPTGFNSSRFLMATAYIGVFVVFLIICSNTFLAIDWNLTQSIHFISNASQELAVPALWKYRLWNGRNVLVPAGIRAVIYLSDDSKLYCQSETQIAIQFCANRMIHLKSGRITVYANPNKEKPMIVTTPLGEVQAIGTIFTVELTR